MSMKIRSVTQVTRYIKALLDGDEELADLWVEGEISNFSRASSGHCYFTLKDGESEIRCVMWRGQAGRLFWQPAQGDWVEAHGYVSVYERGGAYQFYADVIERGGVGARWREFEELKNRLQAEGLFDEARKRSLPKWPHRIGVVTSPTGAALQDILNVLAARYPLVEVVLSPSLVQGVQAPASLVQALGRLNAIEDIDVILIARGGGSLEDLWAFNDERVARAIAACRVPVVSGVGHEIDFTIADFVADVRAPTPSAAAAAVVPDRQELAAQVNELKNRLEALVKHYLEERCESLDTRMRWLQLHDPRRMVAEQCQRVDDLMHRLRAAAEQQVSLRRTRLAAAQATLQAMNPDAVLSRGYAMIQDALSGRIVPSIGQAHKGQDIIIRLQDGNLEAEVTQVAEDSR